MVCWGAYKQNSMAFTLLWFPASPEGLLCVELRRKEWITPFGTNSILLPPPWFSDRCYCFLKVGQTGKQSKIIKHWSGYNLGSLIVLSFLGYRIHECLSGNSLSCVTIISWVPRPQVSLYLLILSPK